MYEVLDLNYLSCWGNLEEFKYVRKIREYLGRYLTTLKELIIILKSSK
jgi:hypothetical protein